MTADRPTRLDRRAFLALAAGVGVSGCAVVRPGPAGAPTASPPPAASPGTPSPGSPSPTSPGTASPSPSPTGTPRVRLGAPIGDGSQAPSPDPQPFQRPITRLRPGERPPQFVVFSWDGASGNQDAILDYVRAARAVDGTQTMFLSALYFLPKSKRTQYQPPRRPAGDSQISFMSDATVRRTIIDISAAWAAGNEIGTHFCGHFSDPNGVPSWTSADWEQELSQVDKLVTTWRTITGWTDIDPLPFDHRRELVGGRTPELAGRATLLPVIAKRGWRYDSSGVRPRQAWPAKDRYGLYDMSMFQIPFRGGRIIPMDYNFLVVQAGGKTNGGSASQRRTWKAEHADALRNALQLCLRGNRAPLILGNHMTPWVGGVYQENLLALMTEFGRTPEVQLVSHRWLCDWLDAQDPAVLQALQKA
ncbi:hypothetical protein G7070_10360 [Propioniciclava coleopterorum]|uniref:Polysaccharide deacetylase n=1 Tax=Propioniciclava coleopterorum TaxID=2714937 RepID=A0A6G7Y729_9ACTN|nr:hypothetical protein [Propioniciclava coleopterorum]QIK72593.1 hypothetical protein G7070_10360 [Propioniciclava coleopterorum]